MTAMPSAPSTTPSRQSRCFANVKDIVRRNPSVPVPLHIRNAPTNLMKELGYGKDYQYAHDLKEKVADMECLPDSLRERRYYFPGDQGYEKEIGARLKLWWGQIRRRKE